MNRYILIYKSSHEAIENESRLQGHGYKMRMIPTPRGISSECGFSLRIDSEDPDFLKSVISLSPSLEAVYIEKKINRSRKYEQILRR